NPDAIVISPGPGTPDESGLSLETIERYQARYPLLGVCLGHQAIGQVFGGKIVRAPTLFHGKVSEIQHDGKTIFTALPTPFTAPRSHSLWIEPSSLPDCLEVTARTVDGVIMGVRHRELPIEGVQFHPESALTGEGKHLLRNFLDLVAERSPTPTS